MYIINDKKIISSSSPAILVKLAPLIIAGFFLGQTNAQSQTHNLMDHNHPNVTVDLSVISGQGGNPPPSMRKKLLPRLSDRKLLRPGSKTPRSMLHIPTATNVPLLRPKKEEKIKTKAKSMLHVPPAKMQSTQQIKKKGKNEVLPKKNITTQNKKIDVAAVEPKKKNPTPSNKVALTTKAIPLKPAVSPKTPKKLQAEKSPTSAKPVSTLKQTTPPSTPSIKGAPEIRKKLLPAPPTVPVAKKKPTKQQASLTPTEDLASAVKTLRVSFSQDQTKLPVDAKKPLILLAESMKGTVNQRLQLMAYAGGPSLSSSMARRMSLSRALAIRSFLIEKGVRSTRIDVRALGNKTTEKPLNRVDLKITER